VSITADDSTRNYHVQEPIGNYPYVLLYLSRMALMGRGK
jgi:hypothetical protein